MEKKQLLATLMVYMPQDKLIKRAKALHVTIAELEQIQEAMVKKMRIKIKPFVQ